jgi:Uma2 family endonuclease
MAAPTAYLDWTPVPRVAIELPLLLPPPDGFEPGDVSTWPLVNGRLEYVDGRLLYMPPCGDEERDTVSDVVVELGSWARSHPGFVVGTNEAGVMLGRDVRGADAAVWRRDAAGPHTGGFRKVPPLLVVEVSGKDEPPAKLLEKADWYLRHGVEVVWVLVPSSRSVIVKTPSGSTEVGPGSRLPAHPALPGLEPLVDDLFRQVSRG